MNIERTALRHHWNWRALFKDALLAALVAGALALPFLGMRTLDEQGGLRLEYRLTWVLIAMLAVFVGRLAMCAWTSWRQQSRPAPAAKTTEKLRRVGLARNIAIVALIAASLLPVLPFSSRYLVDTATTVLIYIMLGWGLNVVVGLAGLLDLGYVAFYAVGAYSYALLAAQFHLTFWECLPLAGLFAAFFGLALGFPVLRLRGDYLAIVTLGFGEIIRIVLLNWQDVTGGPNGITGIARPSFFGMPFSNSPPEGVTAFHSFFGLEYSSNHRIVFLYYVILVLALVTNFFTLRIRRLPIGRAWEALREDEIACRALGINPTNTKLTAFAIGAMFGGFAGAFFATRQGFISPESFTFMESATILAIVVLGGLGSQLGVVIAACVLILLPEFGREFAQFRMLIFGAAMIAIMVWRPKGFVAHREPSLKLPPRPTLPSS